MFEKSYVCNSLMLCTLFMSESDLTTIEKIVHLHEFIQSLEKFSLEDFAENR